MSAAHAWIRSPLGHGDMYCTQCHGTNREIMVIGDINVCTKAHSPLGASPESSPSHRLADPKQDTPTITEGEGSVIEALRAEEDRRRDRAWELHGQYKLEDGSYELGFAHGIAHALKALHPPPVLTVGGGGA